MNLKLQISGGNADGLVAYLENYLRIRQSLLMEIDVQNRCFITKGFVDVMRTGIRYSVLKFEDSNILFVSDTGNATSRIQVGILNNLGNFIKIIKKFNSYLTTDDSFVDVDIKYESALNDRHEECLGATSITFKSKDLKIKYDCFKVSELLSLTDSDYFDKIFKVTNGTRFLLKPENIRNIISISEIATVRSSDSYFYFDIKNGLVCATDTPTVYNGAGELLKESKYQYDISKVEGEPNSDEICIPLGLDNFIKLFGKEERDYYVTIGYTLMPDGTSTINRVLFESVDTKTSMVMSKEITDNDK